MRRNNPLILSAMAAGLLCAMAGAALSAEHTPSVHPGAAASAPLELIKDPRALAALKMMSDRLAAATAFTVRTRNSVPMVGPNGQWISLIGTSSLALQRPDKLFVERAGDQVPLDVYYDGRNVTLYAPAEKLYAEIPAPATIDAALNAAFDVAEHSFPYVEVLLADPFAAMSANLLGALYVGESTVAGVKTEHLALASPGVDWEIWIGAEDKLPRLVQARHVDVEKVPTVTTEFYDWTLNPTIPTARFAFAAPPDAERIERLRLHAPGAGQGATGAKHGKSAGKE